MIRRFAPAIMAAVLAASAHTTNGPAAAPPPSPHDPTHPVVMQQAGTTGASPSHPFISAAPLSTVATGPQREVFGFVQADALNDPNTGDATWNFSELTTVAFFGLTVQDGGAFDQGASSWQVWNSSELTDLLNRAHAKGTKVVLTIIKQDFASGTPDMCMSLSNSSTTVTAAVNEAKAKGVDGINVDYEGLNGSCSTTDPSWARHAFTSFVASLRSAMTSTLGAGSYLSVDTYASAAADPLGFFDIVGLAPSADSFFVMAYDLEYSNYSQAPTSCGSFCLGPTAPLTTYHYNDTSTASQYMSVVAASKIILGVPYYGRKSCVAAPYANQIPTGAVVADRYVDAAGEISSNQVAPGSYVIHRDPYDASGQERWDTWVNPTLGCTRELYWDDTASLGQKYALVNSDGLRGVGIWNLNYGGGAPELWCLISSYFSPAGAALYQGPPAITSIGSASGPVTGGTTVTINGCRFTGASAVKFGSVSAASMSAVSDSQVMAVSPAGASGIVDITVSATAGTSSPSPSDEFTYMLFTSYFNWFDLATAGMVGDNIHLLNTSANPANITVSMSGATPIATSLAPRQETYVSFGAGHIGGPVTVTADQQILASQRVQYFQSFNEVWAMSSAQAATVLYIPWFDRATPGMVGDNIHVLNINSTPVTVNVSLPGAAPINFSLGAGQETYVSFPPGTIGGPVTVQASQPVLAAQRVQYYQSFNEEVARPASQAQKLSYFNWFDKATAGMVGDNLHILNPGAQTANVRVSLAGASDIVFPLQAGQETYVTFAYGQIGGPVTVSSDQPVLAAQRVQYFQSFNEVPQLAPGQAQTSNHVMWFDKVTGGMVGDNLHILNPGTQTANVRVSLPGASDIVFPLQAGQETYVTFAYGHIGGPVTVSSDQPVLAAQRVQYFQSFNEVAAS